MEVYKAFIKALQVPDEDRPGLHRFLERVVKNKRQQIENAGAPDPDAAFEMWIRNVSTDDFPESAFGRVMAEALSGQNASTISS